MSSEERYKETIRLKIEQLVRQTQTLNLEKKKKEAVQWFVGQDGRMVNHLNVGQVSEVQPLEFNLIKEQLGL
jgi:hypothetical protein